MLEGCLFGWVDDTKTTVTYWESHQVSVRIIERVLATFCKIPVAGLRTRLLFESWPKGLSEK